MFISAVNLDILTWGLEGIDSFATSVPASFSAPEVAAWLLLLVQGGMYLITFTWVLQYSRYSSTVLSRGASIAL